MFEPLKVSFVLRVTASFHLVLQSPVMDSIRSMGFMSPALELDQPESEFCSHLLSAVLFWATSHVSPSCYSFVSQVGMIIPHLLVRFYIRKGSVIGSYFSFPVSLLPKGQCCDKQLCDPGTTSAPLH